MLWTSLYHSSFVSDSRQVEVKRYLRIRCFKTICGKICTFTTHSTLVVPIKYNDEDATHSSHFFQNATYVNIEFHLWEN